jgi:hypothetical protein
VRVTRGQLGLHVRWSQCRSRISPIVRRPTGERFGGSNAGTRSRSCEYSGSSARRSSLDERGRRLRAAAEAKAAGYGGIAAASRVTKLARSTTGRGLKDLRDPGSLGRRCDAVAGGSPRLATKDSTRGDARAPS